MDFNRYDIEMLLADFSFREWVYRATPELNAYWEDYQRIYPDKIDSIKIASEFLLQVEGHVEADYPDEFLKNRLFERIIVAKESRKIDLPKPWLYWVAACCIALISLCGYLTYESIIPHPTEEVTYQHLVEESPTELREFINCKEIPVKVTLSDGSEVKLEPGSKISYPENFGAHTEREVYLEGTAFFNVTKNPDAPFIVYANELVTKVLGTSFWILKLQDSNELLVEVVSGKVAVSTKYKSKIKTEEPVNQEGQIFVTPNQQLLYSRKDVSIRKSLVPRPLVIQMPVFKEELEFDDVAVSHVFKAIEKAYGVEIQYDESRFEKCLVTASLSGEPLYETIGAICEAMNARYHVTDTKIVIEGYGCPN